MVGHSSPIPTSERFGIANQQAVQMEYTGVFNLLLLLLVSVFSLLVCLTHSPKPPLFTTAFLPKSYVL